MRVIRPLCLLSALLLIVFPAYSQRPILVSPNTSNGPLPGTRELQLPRDRQVAGAERSAADLARLRQDATELAQVSASIPADIDRVSQGILPKDVIEKLKRVEKLSKHLRSGLIQ